MGGDTELGHRPRRSLHGPQWHRYGWPECHRLVHRALQAKAALAAHHRGQIEPFSSNPAQQGTIFCNDGTRSTRYRGIVLAQTAAGAFQLSYGDGTGESSTDRRTFTGPASFTQANRVHHVLAMARAPTDGEIWVNGAKLSVTTSGSGGAIAYGNDRARIGSQGGFSAFSTGFNGRIYLMALYRRSFTPREVHLRARDPYRVIRRPLATARAAQGSVPPPVGDCGKRSIIIAITCRSDSQA